MTTYTIGGYAVDYIYSENDDIVNTALRSVDFSFVMRDDVTTFGYSLEGEPEPDSLPNVRLETPGGDIDGLNALIIDGVNYAAPTYTELQALGLENISVGQVDWPGGTTFVLRFDTPGPGGGTEYFLRLGGAALTPLDAAVDSANSAAAFEAFVASTDYVGEVVDPAGPASGDFGSLSGLPGASATEDDVFDTPIGFFGGTFQGGAGNDIIEAFGQSQAIEGNAGDDTLDGGNAFFSTLDGGEGNDSLTAGDTGNSLFGGPGNDTMIGAQATDTQAIDYMEGGAGDDLMISDVVGSNLYGDEGNDTLVGSGLFDLLTGGEGADLFVPGGYTGVIEQNDVVDLTIRLPNLDNVPDESVDTIVVTLEEFGQLDVWGIGSGDRIVILDALAETSAFSVAYGGEFGDVINVDIGADGSVDAVYQNPPFSAFPVTGEAVGEDLVIHFGTPAPITPGDYALDFLPQDIAGSDMSDTLVGGTADDTIDGGAGDDLLTGGDGSDSLTGGDGDDGLQGQDGDDNLDGGGGNDNLSGSTGNDSLLGGSGDDLMGGGLGDDAMDGSDGNDFMGGGQGADTVDGNTGNDVVNGGPGDDLLIGGADNDTMGASFGDDLVQGGAGDDDMGGGAGRDTIDGGNGNDSAGGGEGDDVINGGDGNDFLAGGGRNDAIDGGAGDDQINAGDGDDTMTGGDGADLFIFNGFNGGDADVVTDFEDGIDQFRMTGVENAPGTGLQGKLDALGITDTAEGALIDYQGHTVLIEGVGAADLGLEDFIFL